MGKRRGKGRGYRKNKTWVAGAIQRGGQVRLARIPNIRKKTLHRFVASTIRDEAEAIYTDELRSYIGIEDDDAIHRTVNHSAEEWVVGDVHTNSIENVWSLFKRSITGAFHKIQHQASGPLPRRAGVEVQQPKQPAHLPRHHAAHPYDRQPNVQAADRQEGRLAANGLT